MTCPSNRLHGMSIGFAHLDSVRVDLRNALIRRVARVVMAILFSATFLGCEPVELSRTKPWWEEVNFDQQDGGPATIGQRTSDGPVLGNDLNLVHENPDGSVEYNCMLPEYFVSNLYALLMNEDYEAIEEHLISDLARENYDSMDKDPHEIVDWLGKNRRDVIILLTRMAQGFNSPDVVWERSGSVYRLKLSGRAGYQFRFTVLDVARERGQFKLVLIK